MNVLFRFDANSEIGAGHASRCATLATAFTAAGAECAIWTTPETLDAFPAVASAGHIIPSAFHDPEKDRTAVPEGRYDLAVIDHYARGGDMESALRARCGRLLVIDDLLRGHPDADLIVDQTLGREQADYDTHVPASAARLTGASYVMVNSAFGAVRERHASRTGRLDHITICFGGADVTNATGKVIDQIIAWRTQRDRKSLRVSAVLGAAAKHRDAVAERVRKLGDDGRLLISLSQEDLAELYAESDLVIGAAGTSSWERCCVGVPSVVFVTGPDQKDNASALASREAALVIKDPDELPNQLSAFFEDPSLLIRLSKRALSVCDGDGAGRIVASASLSSDISGTPIAAFRRIEPKDAQDLFQWQSAAGTRQYFRNPDPPDWETHCRWIDDSLADGTRSLTIAASRTGAPLGLLRFDTSEEGTEVSILVAPEERGKGIGAALLEAARTLRPGVDLLAEVHPENTASQRLFRSAGYRPAQGSMLIQPAVSADAAPSQNMGQA